MFTRSGAAWSQQAKLTASDGAAHDYFGRSVAVSGDTAVIGAPGKTFGKGAAYPFTRAGTAWSQESTVVAPDGVAGDGFATIGDGFGQSVAVSGNSAVIGAPQKASSKGAAYVFTFLMGHLTVNSTPAGRAFTATGTGCSFRNADDALYSAARGRMHYLLHFTRYHRQRPLHLPAVERRHFHQPAIVPGAASDTTYLAQFGAEYLLAAAAPPSGGQVIGGGWYADSANAAVVATPNPAISSPASRAT